MNADERDRLTDAELKKFFDRLFPHGFAGADVLAELAPEGWERSPLLVCFHPSAEQVFRERLQLHRNFEELLRIRRECEPDNPKLAPKPEPTFEEIVTDWKDEPVDVVAELTELLGRCLWDVFSDGHEVITQEGRTADLGSFRAAGGFIASYLDGNLDEWWNGDYLRFYMGTSWISCSCIHDRADLTPIYGMIFHRLEALDADWVYHFPELGIVDLSPLRKELEAKKPEDYSPSESFAREEEEKAKQEELERLRIDLAESNARAHHEALDRPPPVTVRAYELTFGHKPKGWLSY